MLFDSLFSELSTTPTTVQNTKDAWVIEMDMPGVVKENVAVNAVGRILEVRGERKKGERTVTTYSERFQLPDHLQTPDGILAEMSHGVLTIRVPKQPPGMLSIPVH